MTLPNKAPQLANFKQILNVEIVVGFQIVFIHPLVRVHFKIENHTQLLECRYRYASVKLRALEALLCSAALFSVYLGKY